MERKRRILWRERGGEYGKGRGREYRKEREIEYGKEGEEWREKGHLGFHEGWLRGGKKSMAEVKSETENGGD